MLRGGRPECFAQSREPGQVLRFDRARHGLAKLFGTERIRVDLDGGLRQEGVLAEGAEDRVVFGRRRENQRQATGLGEPREDFLVDHPEEPLRVLVDFVRLRPVTMTHGGAVGPFPIGGHRQMGFGPFLSQGVSQRGRHVARIQRVQGVTAALEQRGRLPRQAQHLEPVRRLDVPQQRLDVERPGDDRQFPHGLLELEDLEFLGGSQNRKAVQGMFPEFLAEGQS